MIDTKENQTWSSQELIYHSRVDPYKFGVKIIALEKHCIETLMQQRFWVEIFGLH